MIVKSEAVINGVLNTEYGINTDRTDDIIYGIPKRSFPFEWDDVPEGTESFAVEFMDYDNTEDEGVPWVHWIALGIAPDKRCFKDNEAADADIINGKNSWSMPYAPYDQIPDSAAEGYGGPAPGRPHEYELTVYALDFMPEIESGFCYNSFRKTVQEHKISEGKLIFLYG